MYQQNSFNSKRTRKIFKYNILIDPNKTIKYVELSYYIYCHCTCEKKWAKIWLLANDGEITKRCLSQRCCKCFLNAQVTNLQLISTEKLKFCYINIVYKYESGWIFLPPRGSIQLPTEPSTINLVSCYLFTSAEKTSTIAIGASATSPDKTQTVMDTISKFVFSSSSSFESSSKFLFNLGESSIYICNLTTALIE